MDKLNVLSEIKGFLEGYNNDLKYLVNVETDPRTNLAECVIHAPGEPPRIVKIAYEPFMYMKDLTKTKYVLYPNKTEDMIHSKRMKYGIKITKLKTGNQKRLVDGYCYKYSSSKSQNDLINYFSDGGINPFEKARDIDGNFIKDDKDRYIYPNRELFFNPSLQEQFFIVNQCRLYKGFEEYSDVHKLTFDCETEGLRYQIHRLFAIGVRDNRGFETILEVEKLNDDEAEKKLILDYFNLINYIKPAIISGYNSEDFDFDFIMGRVKVLKLSLEGVPTSLKPGIQLFRKPNTSVKYGNTAEKYTATFMWGFSVIDIHHAAKKTQAINSDIKNTKLKYIAQFEKIAKPNRTYIEGEGGNISKFYAENKIFLMNEKNEYTQIPDEWQQVGRNLYKLQANKGKLSDDEHKLLRDKYLKENRGFIGWFREVPQPKEHTIFISGKKLLRAYLLDDLWETEQVDEAYNQSSFMLAKIVPTTYHRVCTMGTASIWNLLLTAWSYENDLAIPIPDVYEKFSGGLARCYKVGYTTGIIKIDFASLYPMLQLTHDIFPMFDITGVMKKMLLYLTTTRNIYKKIANGDDLNKEEISLLQQIDHELHHKVMRGDVTAKEMAMAKIKQLPIKILNNSLFGALGSHISFNWSDNICAAKITCSGRIELRHAISWFSKYGCVALLAVTDGVNFQIPVTTNIRVSDEGEEEMLQGGSPNDMWHYRGIRGINALIEKFNVEEMTPPFMAVDNDGESTSCLNLSRINYATLSPKKDKKTGEITEKIKLTGNTIKSKVMPEYIEDFIDEAMELILHGKGKEFVERYYDYAENIFYQQIPLKKIASKSKVKLKLSAYKKRGTDKNGKPKASQAHMELLIQDREKIACELFEEHKENLGFQKKEENLTAADKMKLVVNYMPQEPELDSVVYYVNTGERKSHGDVKKDPETKEVVLRCKLINAKNLMENPEMTGTYNFEKYLDAFNKRVESILVGFDPEIQKKILARIVKGELKKEMFTSDQLEMGNYNSDDFNDSMNLEELEVGFWNKTGYDPRKIWDGFTMSDGNEVYFEIYDDALNYLNEKMLASGKQYIKSINDDYGAGDLVLIKDGGTFNVGSYDGTFMKIVRENVDIPKHPIQIEIDRKKEVEERKLEELEITMAKKTDAELFQKAQMEKRQKYFEAFLKLFNFDVSKFTLAMLEEQQDGFKMLDEFIENTETATESAASEYLDDGGDGAY